MELESQPMALGFLVEKESSMMALDFLVALRLTVVSNLGILIYFGEPNAVVGNLAECPSVAWRAGERTRLINEVALCILQSGLDTVFLVWHNVSHVLTHVVPQEQY